ncbi:hypothetical protein MNVI_34100 [Mycobacterium noviomagense]|uniref:Uncharacterized protein n=1 Tax=Mycobacterium noviomagense TaxID=459858 RepID=A0A7I7PHQ6_9MYCO|nr:hypothetical protein MNVI_34100 [Mycobacterium noviomagense]
MSSHGMRRARSPAIGWGRPHQLENPILAQAKLNPDGNAIRVQAVRGHARDAPSLHHFDIGWVSLSVISAM